MLSGVAHVLKPGGRLLAQFGGRGNIEDLLRACREVIAEPDLAGFFEGFAYPCRFHGPDEYAPMLSQAGLEPIRVDWFGIDAEHEGVDALRGYLRTTKSPFTQRLPEARRDELIERILHRYLQEHPPDEHGRTFVRMMRLEVEAVQPPEQP
jgi:trans-aconitate methyltransferase